MAIRLSENFRALFYAPFYAAHAIGAYQAEGVEVELLSLARSRAHRRRAAQRRDRCDVGRAAARDADPRTGSGRRQRVLLRRHRARSVLHHRPRAAAGFPHRRSRGVRFASVAEVPTPWLCLQDDLRRAGVDPAA